jgi:cell division protein FtsI (penicillin-binding protein 3)
VTPKRLRLTFSAIFLLLGLLAVRLFYIQAVRGLAYSEIAQKQFVRKVRTESYRGSILDRNGNVLASSIESQSVFIRPREIKNQKEAVHLLQTAFALSASEIKEKLNSRQDFVWLERKLTPAQAQLVSESKVAGIGVQSEQRRYYPNGSLGCYVVGSVGMDNHGLTGIEQTMESFLTGKTQVIDQLKDGKGRSIQTEVPAGQASVVNSVELTLDRSLQHAAEQEIKRGVEENRASRGMIILQNPKTGEILAMAAYPNFNPNDLATGGLPSGFDFSKLQNPMVNKVFEPGSTFKLVTLAAALEERKFSASDTLFCENGTWKFSTVTINDHEPSGSIDFSQVMERSSNIGCAKIGLKLGKESLYHYTRAFGFGTKTGVGLPGESEGLLRDPKGWSMVTLPIMAFGQGVGVTALQMVSAFSAIANDGVLVEPQIFKQITESKDGKIELTTFSPQPVRQVVSSQTAKTLQGILRRVVDRGTGAQAKVSGYSTAGKTGTAQKIDPKTRKYSSTDYIASFGGFVPAENPQLVCLVILDSPKRDYWGGSTAAPIFSRVMSRAVHILGIPAQESSPIILARGR